jgi:hypothetical protein
MENYKPNLIESTIGARVIRVGNPYTSIVEIHYANGSESCDKQLHATQLIRIEQCEWELKQGTMSVCHSESDGIEKKMQALIGKIVAGFSWHYKIVTTAGIVKPALWTVIKFSEDWSIGCYPYCIADNDTGRDNGKALYTVLLSIHHDRRELVFLESGEVKVVEH